MRQNASCFLQAERSRLARHGWTGRPAGEYTATGAPATGDRRREGGRAAMSETTAKPTELTREELYELVWSTPMSRLAGRYGLSDVGLAKVCDRHHVPRPPRGY